MTHHINQSVANRPLLIRRQYLDPLTMAAYTLAIYGGCELGCAFCDGWVHAPRDFNQRVYIPTDLPEHLAANLNRIERGAIVAITAASDPYQPAEQQYRLTRRVLEVLVQHRQPCVIQTRSPTILQDLDLLQELHAQALVVVLTSLVTFDAKMLVRLEGQIAPPAERLAMLATIRKAGIPVGVVLSPLIPYVNDTATTANRLITESLAHGADFVAWEYLRLEGHHRRRMIESLMYAGFHASNYYTDVYPDGATLPSDEYQQTRNRELGALCNHEGISIYAPHHLYAGRLAPTMEAALLLQQTGARNHLQRQPRLATIHAELAEQLYNGTLDESMLRNSPIARRVQSILAQPTPDHYRNGGGAPGSA